MLKKNVQCPRSALELLKSLKLAGVEYPFCRVGKLHRSQQESFNSSDLFVKSGITVFRVILSIWKDENHLEPLLERMYNKGIFLFVFDDKIKIKRGHQLQRPRITLNYYWFRKAICRDWLIYPHHIYPSVRIEVLSFSKLSWRQSEGTWKGPTKSSYTGVLRKKLRLV